MVPAFPGGRARPTPATAVITVEAAAPSREVASRATASDIISALDHPLRRSIFRLLLEKGTASATQMADLIPYTGHSSVRSHLDVLVFRGMAEKEKRAGSRESVYSPTDACLTGWVATALILTAEED